MQQRRIFTLKTISRFQVDADIFLSFLFSKWSVLFILIPQNCDVLQVFYLPLEQQYFMWNSAQRSSVCCF